jgi:glycosyltransferase involved in cell wall biosynthesis
VALMAAITSLYRDRERRERLGHNGRRAALARFSRAQMATKYIGVLNSIVSGWRDPSKTRN